MKPNSPPQRAAFSLQEMLVVIAVIGITTLIVLPAVTGLTQKASDMSAKRNAQLLASMTAAAPASGDPAFQSLRSKPALVAYFASSDFTPGGSAGNASLSLSGLSTHDATAAARFLDYHPGSGGLVYSDTADGEGGDGGGGGGEEENADRWNAQLLEGAASMAIANGDTSIPTAGSKGVAINFLVDGGVGGSMVADMTSEEQNGASSYLEYANGTLRYVE